MPNGVENECGVDVAPRSGEAGDNVFDLDDARAYRAWRESKLRRYESAASAAPVEIADATALSPGERAGIRARIAESNMALYILARPPSDDDAVGRALLALGKTFGLDAVEDHRSANRNGVVRIEAVRNGGRLGYIPYTDRAISWHTDGYYNYHGAERCVKAMILHCGNPARAGGENQLLDHEIAYLRLRDRDPMAVRLLMHEQAMTIPASVEASGRVRPENTGPVFYVDRSGALGMRYSARKKFVSWRDEATRQAADTLLALIQTETLVRHGRLAPGQGLICNNVLHDRSAFADGSDSPRLLYRIRFHGRIA